mgnify:CR=1 FL=1|jgi:NAD(P)-dependent dehydrogenase (short-subunit alcohol dehydrogenase family)
MLEGIRDKKVLVADGSGGIGSTIARLFAEYGALVVGVHYNQFRNNAGHLIWEIEKTGGCRSFAGRFNHRFTRSNDSFFYRFFG